MSSDDSIAAVVLAAGFSSRLGQPKQRLTLNGETLVARAVRLAVEAALTPVFVVLQDAALAPALASLGAVVVLNTTAVEGMASSIRCGILEAGKHPVSGAVVLTCDQVALTPGHLRALIAEPDVVAGSAYAGRVGIPAYFPRAVFSALLLLKGDTGARDLLRSARSVLCESLSLDIDTEADRISAGVQNPASGSDV